MANNASNFYKPYPVQNPANPNNLDNSSGLQTGGQVALDPGNFGLQMQPVLNLSGIGYDTQKFQQLPEGIQETDGYTDRTSTEDMNTSRIYLVPWSILDSARTWFLGYSTSSQNGDGTYSLNRFNPVQDPKYFWLYASEFDVLDGLGAFLYDPGNFARDAQGHLLDPNGNVTNDEGQALVVPAIDYAGRGIVWQDGYAKVRVTFRARPYRVANDTQVKDDPTGELARNVEREREASVEAISRANMASYGRLIFDDGPSKGSLIPEAGIILLPSGTAVYTWHDVPDVPYAAIDAARGTINLTAFDGAHGYPQYQPGQLLFLHERIFRTRSVTGRVSHTIRYYFSIKFKGWLNFPNTDGQFWPASFHGSLDGKFPAGPVFQSTEFANLFKVPSPVSYE